MEGKVGGKSEGRFFKIHYFISILNDLGCVIIACIIICVVCVPELYIYS
jgi:hypothetical protein